MDKKKIASMFGIETYEEEKKKLNEDVATLSKSLEKLQETNKVLASEVIKAEDLAESLKGEIKKIKADPEAYIEEEVERRMLGYEEKVMHTYINIGRMDAYREMGIRALDANRDNNSLVIMEDGSIVELITDLEDVYDEKVDKHLEEEITIDDLVGI